MIWWMWIALGVLLLVMEMVLPGGLFFLFFGFGAILTGVFAGLDLITESTAQWSFFGISSVLLLFFLRARINSALHRSGDKSTADLNGLVGTIGTIASDIQPNEVGQVEVRGSAWSARNIGGSKLSAGARCRVDSIDGLTLKVRAE